jgi:hypothetical protein
MNSCQLDAVREPDGGRGRDSKRAVSRLGEALSMNPSNRERE